LPEINQRTMSTQRSLIGYESNFHLKFLKKENAIKSLLLDQPPEIQERIEQDFQLKSGSYNERLIELIIAPSC